jgi:hypothetical protein
MKEEWVGEEGPSGIVEYRAKWARDREAFNEGIPVTPFLCPLGFHKRQTLRYTLDTEYWLRSLTVCTRCWHFQCQLGFAMHGGPVPVVWDINDRY